VREKKEPSELPPLLGCETRSLFLQRTVDVAISGLLLAAASPIFVVTALAIYFTDRGSVFYTQTRAGLTGKPFTILKFRSMRPHLRSMLEAGEVGHDDPLVTPIGRWIRRFKIDELPQLLNVFLGDMSLVGPRPRPMEQAALEGEFERRRLARRPGMTGWAQVNGGVELSWSDRILLDVWYVDHWSLWLDITILASTLAVVIFGEVGNQRAVEVAALHAAEIGRSS
jgi:lipopolysaccharide/colanic/teichoic acid biosynthesis glycosyltransferase